MLSRTFYKENVSHKEVVGDFYLSSKRFSDIGIYKLWEDEQAFGTLFVGEEKNGNINKVLCQNTSSDAENLKMSFTREENGLISNFVKEGFGDYAVYSGFMENNKGQVEFLNAEDVNKGIDECLQFMQEINLKTMLLNSEVVDCTVENNQ